MNSPIVVIGAGLAGSECAWQLARRGRSVTLIEMRPKKFSPAHSTDKPAELVCSNSLRSNDPLNAVGLLKQEMQALDSLIVKSAHTARVPAGSALAVDRDVFSKTVEADLVATNKIEIIHDIVTHLESSENNVTVCLESGNKISCEQVVVATGPLTDEKLAGWIREATGSESLYFYDSIAPIVSCDSIDMSSAFRGNRYDKSDKTHPPQSSGQLPPSMGEQHGDYINCPMTQKQYENFITEIQNAELVAVHDFDKAQFFDGCLPIEEMVRRGPETLRFGPMKPVGFARWSMVSGRWCENKDFPAADTELTRMNQETEKLHAIVQLRQDNVHGTLYNMVGFQTRLKYGEQQRIFRKIPGLENAEFVRLGSMHRNTYLCSPRLLESGMALKNNPRVHFAGQITGCEGYVESAAVGLYVGLHLAQVLTGCPPQTTALGALVNHLLRGDPKNYQPMNINFGLFSPLGTRVKKTEKKQVMVDRAVNDFHAWCASIS